MAYTHAQKNCGASGTTIMILNEKCLKTNPLPILPEICSLKNYKEKNGYFADMNIIPVFSNYVMSKHIRENGGVNMNQYQKRSQRLYDVFFIAKLGSR
jgi:phosphoserine aminotransferase